MKLKNSICDETQIVMKLKNSKTQIVKNLITQNVKNSNCDQTQNSNCERKKNSNCYKTQMRDETQKLKL